MRRIYKSEAENELVIYAIENPKGTWEDFRNHNNGASYKNIKFRLFDDQKNLCAYCETSLEDISEHNKRVEHFRSKSDEVKGTVNAHLDWLNLLGVCVGGSDFENRTKYELPQNLSCDSHKSYLEETENIVDKNWIGKVLSPLSIPDPHNFFSFDKATGNLIPNISFCKTFFIEDNQLQSTEELVRETIRVFNLNCDRLNKARLRIFHFFQKEIKLARKNKDVNRLRDLAIRWTRGKPLSFQTTRSLMLTDSPLTLRFLM